MRKTRGLPFQPYIYIIFLSHIFSILEEEINRMFSKYYSYATSRFQEKLINNKFKHFRRGFDKVVLGVFFFFFYNQRGGHFLATKKLKPKMLMFKCFNNASDIFNVDTNLMMPQLSKSVQPFQLQGNLRPDIST